MKNRFLFLWILIAVFYTTSAFAANSIFFANRIEGRVYNPQRIPVENVYVELRNEVESPIAQTKTDASGRFTFVGMPGGRYTVKVLPLRTNFMEQTQEVYITSTRPNSSDTAYVDIYLTYDKRSRESTTQKSPQVIFVQEIPPAAKKLYEAGVDDLSKKQDKGFAELEEALKISPDYFDALSLLGKEYVLRKNYEKAYPYLLKAIDINPRSYSSFFRLGYAFYQLKQYTAALKAANAAVILAPDSADAQQLCGTILRINENFAEAEKTLLKANSLSQGKNSETHFQLALLYNRLNRNPAAINELEIYLKLEPESPDKIKIQRLIAKLKAAETKAK
jgi:Carboxypeptidase regulatory-like domain/Tetratricopeptide repeat